MRLYDDPALVSEDELRRYLRSASVLLAEAAVPTLQRITLLRRARCWVNAVLGGVEQLLHEAETADGSEQPLTPDADPARIRG